MYMLNSLLQARDSLLFAAVLLLLVSIAIASVEMENRQKDYEDEALERSRGNGARAVDEVNVGAEDNEQAVAGQDDVELVPAAQLRHRKLSRRLVQQIPKMSRRFVQKIPEMGKALNFSRRKSGSEGYSGGIEENPSAMAMEPNLPHDGENFLGTVSSCSTESDGQNFLGRPPLENEATRYSEAHESYSYPAITSRSVHGSSQGDTVIDMSSQSVGSNGRREESQRDPESVVEDIKDSLKFSYFSTGIACAGILGFLSGFISDQKGQTGCIHLKICTVLILATIVCGATMILLILLCSFSRVCIRIVRYLKYATLGLLTLATFDASILFLEGYALLAFVPTAVIVVVAFIIELSSSRQ